MDNELTSLMVYEGSLFLKSNILTKAGLLSNEHMCSVISRSNTGSPHPGTASGKSETSQDRLGTK